MATEEKYYENRFCVPFCKPSTKKAVYSYRQDDKADITTACKTMHNEETEAPSLNLQHTKDIAEQRRNDEEKISQAPHVDEKDTEVINPTELPFSDCRGSKQLNIDILDQEENSQELIKLSTENSHTKDDVEAEHIEASVMQHVIEDVLELNDLIKPSETISEETNPFNKTDVLKDSEEPISPSTAIDESLYDGFPDSAINAENHSFKSEDNLQFSETQDEVETVSPVEDVLQNEASDSHLVTPGSYSMFKCCIGHSKEQESLVY